MIMRRAILTVTTLALWTALCANADVTTWTGTGAGADQWSDPNCWSAGVPDAGDSAAFATEGYLVNFDGDSTIAGLLLDPNASGSRWLILGEYTLTTGSIVNDSTAGTLLDLATDVNAPDTGLSVLANAGPITLAGAGPDYVETITLNGDLEIGGDNDVYIYGPIVGDGGITKDGSGTLLIHVNEYTNEFLGDVTLNDGLLVLDGYDSNDMDNPTGNALGYGNIYLYGGTLGFTGNLSEDYEMINPTQTLYVGGPDGNTVTIDAAHIGAEIPLGDDVTWSHYVAGLDNDSNDGFDVVIMNSLVLGYDDGNEIVPANLVLGNPTDGDELLVEFELMVEDDPNSSTITLLGTDVMHELTAYTEAEIEHKITGDGGLSITSDSTGLLILLNTENDFSGGLELNGGTLVVADSNQTGTSTLGTGTLTINGDAVEFGKVIVSGTPKEIYYDDEWLDEDDNSWDGSVDSVEIGNDVKMQGNIAFAGYSFVEMDDWFDDGNDVEVAMIGSNIEISGTTTLVGDTAIAVVTEDTDADDEVSDDAIADLNLAENYFTLEISGAIGESGGSRTLAKYGDGTLILSGVNTFTGGLNVNEGTVLLDIEDAVAAAPVTIGEDGTVEFGADQTLLALNGSGLLDAQANNLTLASGQSSFDGTFENLLDVTIAGGTHVIDANMSVQSLAVDAGTLTLNGDIGSDQAITIASGATAVVNGAVEFYFGDAIGNSGTLVGDTSSLGDVAIDLKDDSTLKADEDGLVASSVSIDSYASVTLDSSDGLLTLDDPTFHGGTATISQTGDSSTSISNLDNRVGCTITLDTGTLYLTGDEIWACDWPGAAGGEIIVEEDATLIVDAPTHFIDYITGDGEIVKTVNAYASEEDYLNDLGIVDGNDLTLADATIATSQGGTLEITKDVEIEESATVGVVGESTVVVSSTLAVTSSATLDVDDDAQLQIDGAVDVGEGETLNVTGGGTVAINSSNTALGSTATVAVSDSTLELGSASATGSAQVSLTNSTVQATADEVEIETATLSGTVAVTGNTVAVQTLSTTGNTTLQVASSSAVEVDGTLDVDEGETLNVTGGGTVAINSSNTTLGSTATVAVSDSTLKLGSATATGRAQVSLTNSTVQATADEVEIETATLSGTVAVTGNTVAVQTLSTTGNTTLQVASSSAVEVDGTLDVDEGETLNVTGGGTVAINSSNTTLGSTATVAVSDSTLELGSATATGSAQVSLTNSTVQATADEVEIETASVSGNVTFSGNSVVVGTLNTSAGAASLTTGDAGVEVETLSGTNDVTVTSGKVTLTGDSAAYTQQLDVSSEAEVEVDASAVLGGSVTLAGTGTINGTVEGAVTVDDASAVLGGSGDFEGGLTIASGTLEPGQSPGEITVSGGDFVLGAGATLNVEVDEEGNHDSIRITDDSNANFVTGAKVVAVAIGDALDGTYDIVTLEGSGSIQVDGNDVAADTSLAAFIENTDLATINSLVVDETGQIVQMDVDFTSNTEYLQGTESRTVTDFGRMLDSDAFAQSATDDLQEVIAQAQASDDVAGSYAQMTNQLQTSASSAASHVVSTVNVSLSQRMQNARTVARNTLTSPTYGPLLASLSPMSISDPSRSGWQAFVQGYGSWGDRDDDGGVVGYDYDTYGTLVGAEKFVTENVVLGGSIGYGGTSVDSGDDLSSMDIDSLSASLYGTWFNSDSYVGLTLGYGYHWYDSARKLTFAGLSADGEFDAQTLSIAPEVGKLFQWGSYGIEPYVGLNYTHFSQDGYTEDGAGDADLSISDDSDDSFCTELGTRLHRTWAMRNGGSLTPELKLAWRHEFADEVVTIAQLAGSSTSFKTTGLEVVDDIFDVGVALNWQIGKSKTLCAQYDAELGSGFEAHTLQTYIKIQF